MLAELLAATAIAAMAGLPQLDVAAVARWVDGDTVHVVDRTGSDVTVRLSGVDAPEFRSYGGRSECVAPEAARRAAEAVERLAPPRTVVRLVGDSSDRYGRRLAEVHTVEGDVGERLVVEGHARRWPDGPCRWPADR